MTERFRLLQVCNVGRVTGGTGACAWTVTRALPDWDHSILFFSPPDVETRKVFEPAQIVVSDKISQAHLSSIHPDLILFHNTSVRRLDPKLSLPVSVYYCHSKVTPIECDQTVCCSEYLRECSRQDVSHTVLHQAVPRPLRPAVSRESRCLRESLIVGRLCTPCSRKWPENLVSFYQELSQKHPEVQWEFVGCPENLQAKLNDAVRGRVIFLPASFGARARFWNWDALLYHHPDLTETFGRTVAEAMRAGCIPVVDDRGGFREQITEGTGILCRNRQEYSAALSQIVDVGERRRRSRRCRAHADEHFSLQQFRSHLLKTFRAGVQTRSPTPVAGR